MSKELDMKEGVYFHDKKGFAVASYLKDQGFWEVDKNKTKNHPIFRVKINVVERLTGEYFFSKSLKDYEYIGEL